ncbi:MAG: DUF3488 domain-containing protein [Gammaproteobacteria bacterium]|nr:MAG: DUF3488 domain-containing protein [Gammaproteobacteria bacterium]
MSSIIRPLFPSLPILLWLMTTLVLVVLPHSSRLPGWILVAFFVSLGWRYLITYNKWPVPNMWVQFALALLILLGLSLSYGSWLGRQASIALLVVLCGLKLLEMNSLRDALLLCFLSYFLIITHFLHSQSIPTALYMGIVMLVITATLISLNDKNNACSTRQRLRLSAILLMQALPVMVVLFILFPRVAGPFWMSYPGANSGVTGLSDTLSFGQVSELSLSDEIAFRVKFQGEIPPLEQRYWRGPVLWRIEGHNWKGGIQQHTRMNKINISPTSLPYDYTVTLEPHNQRWLFALDLPIQAPPKAYINPDYQMFTHLPVRQRMRYSLRSYTDYQARIFTSSQNHFALRLPKGSYPRTRALAKQWRQENLQPMAIVQRALQYFNQEPFMYSYTPPLLLNDPADNPVDEFLFETRSGFCEHYAVAFTVLMRAAGIPARIVTGYLGGNVNPIGDYLIVRQRDAHAWSEVWLSDKGWVRIDPTSAIAPERVEQGIDRVLPTVFNPLGGWAHDSALAQIFEQMRHTWDAFNNGWNQWILGYNPARQQQLLSSLGLSGLQWRGMTILMVLIIAVLLLSYAAWMFLQRGTLDPAQRIYLHFCKKLARYGLPRHPSEGPLNYAARMGVAHPDLAADIQIIIELYVQIRYHSQTQRLPQLRMAVQHFRP